MNKWIVIHKYKDYLCSAKIKIIVIEKDKVYLCSAKIHKTGSVALNIKSKCIRVA